MIFNANALTTNEVVNGSKNRTGLIFEAFKESYIREFNSFWNNPEGYTPIEMAAAWGADAALLFQNSTLTRNYLLSVDPNCLNNLNMNVPYDITINKDGTVTVVAQ